MNWIKRIFSKKAEKKCAIDSVMVRNTRDWRIGKYYISESFEVIQYKSCGNGNNACVGHGNTFDDAVKKLTERNKEWRLVDQKEVDGVLYWHYAP